MNNLAFFELYLPKVFKYVVNILKNASQSVARRARRRITKNPLTLEGMKLFSKLGKAKWKRDWVLVLASTKIPYALTQKLLHPFEL